MRLFPALLLLLTASTAHAQWDLEDPPTTADLRGVSNTGGGAVWASGTHGTVVRSEDGGYLWQACAVPPGAENLDFRGIQAFDENTAIVMSSGKGDLSRLYKTTDGCHTWKFLFANPDKEGFWDAIQFEDRDHGALLGDPVHDKFVLMATVDGGNHWVRDEDNSLTAPSPKTGGFAASNSILLAGPYHSFATDGFATGGPEGAFFYKGDSDCTMGIAQIDPASCAKCCLRFDRAKLPLNGSSSSSGVFSLGSNSGYTIVAVGGDYTAPDQASGTAGYFNPNVRTWSAAQTPPHGYRSAVAYDPDHKAWI